MADFTMSVEDGGVAVIRFDAATRTMNTLTRAGWDQLSALVEQIAARNEIKGAVIISAKTNGFCAGADLDEMIGFAGSTPTDPAEQERRFDFMFQANRVARAIETSAKPFVAAINGLALGGGLELALACHHRIANDNPRWRIGLPEATIGLLPGGGGTQRLARLLGVERALPLLLNGTAIDAAAALDLGLIDEIVAEGGELNAAERWLAAGHEAVVPWDQAGFTLPGEPGGLAALADTVAGDPGGNYPAAANILAAVREGALLPMDLAIELETRCFLATLQSPQAKAMIRTLFRSHPALRKGPAQASAASVRKVAVLGAGMMGAGIAFTFAKAGVETILLDVSQEAAAKGKDYSVKLLGRLVPKGLFTQAAADRLLANITPGSDYALVAGSDLLVETVFEDIDIKAAATVKALAFLPADILIASNTSTLPISRLAQVHPTPENFVGMHFHSPVDRMELVEVVRGRKTSPTALARALAIVRQIGKTAIVANDSPFFYTSRVFDTYIREGMEMLIDGFAPTVIDQAGKLSGMPRGPLELTDDVAIDLVGRIASQRTLLLGDAATRRGSDDVVDMLLAADRFGRKNGKGFYDYPANAEKYVWTGFAERWPVTRSATDDVIADLRRRFLHRQAVEAARCVAEGVIEDPRHADVGALLGWNFPRWTGGPLSYIEQIGIARFVQDCDAWVQAGAERFAPPAQLRQMIASGDRYYDGLAPAKAA